MVFVGWLTASDSLNLTNCDKFNLPPIFFAIAQNTRRDAPATYDYAVVKNKHSIIVMGESQLGKRRVRHYIVNFGAE